MPLLVESAPDALKRQLNPERRSDEEEGMDLKSWFGRKIPHLYDDCHVAYGECVHFRAANVPCQA